ncbi:SgrR family transcriptional regulator [Salmonella enterica]
MPIYAAYKKSGLLRRYSRLLLRYDTHRHELSLSQIAETLECTARYARTLLSEMQEEKWLVWRSHPGRGALSILQCRMSSAEMRILLEGEYEVPEEKTFSDRIAPPVSSDGYRYIISFYRPLLTPAPGIHVDRAGRHILQMVHVGLTRHVPESRQPKPGLAHTIIVSEDRLSWHFILRRGLVWQNGELFQPEQLLVTLQHYAGGPGLPHVTDVVINGYTLSLHLKQPDVMLCYRLASPAYVLPHPEHPTVGLGPFKVSEHSDTRMVLTRAPNWYGETPLAAEIVYSTPLSNTVLPAVVQLDTSCSLLARERSTPFDKTDAFYYVTFNLLRGRLNSEQQAVIRQIARSISTQLITDTEDAVALPDWLQPAEELPVQALLPESLNIIYFRSREMKKWVDELVKSLRYRGCQVNATPLSVAHWLLPDKSWQDQDICLGFLRFEQHDAFTLEERFRHSVMVPSFWGQHNWLRGILLLDRTNTLDEDRYRKRVLRVMRYAIAKRWITPLFLQRYRLIIPPCIHGIFCYPQGWPDYTRLWTDEQIESALAQPKAD